MVKTNRNGPYTANYLQPDPQDAEIVLGIPFLKKFWIHFDWDADRIGIYNRSEVFGIVLTSVCLMFVVFW
jgi:hypothetical protein